MTLFIVVMYLASYDVGAIFSTTYIYTFVLLLPIFLIFYLLNDTINMQTLMAIGGLLLFIAFIVIGYTTKLLNFLFVGYLYYIFVLIITILTLAIIYNVAINNLQKQDGILGFIINFIFYIPCLVSDAIQYMINDYKSTSQVVFILFIMEISVILFYFYIIPYITDSITSSGNIIQSDPLFLNKTTVIPATVIQPITLVDVSMNTNAVTNDNPMGLQMNIYDPYNFQGNVRKNFTISLWCYMNQPTTSRIAPNYMNMDRNHMYGANIFYYGTPSTADLNADNTTNTPPFQLLNGSYHPRLAYYIDQEDSYYVIDTNTDDKNRLTRFELRLPMQRWNNFVFTYNANSVDVFINGHLERTVKYSVLPDIRYATDIMAMGSNPKTITDSITPSIITEDAHSSFMGLYGSICNVVYYSNTLDQGQIISNYNLLATKNPPIPF
jgi:hypothetical protein